MLALFVASVAAGLNAACTGAYTTTVLDDGGTVTFPALPATEYPSNARFCWQLRCLAAPGSFVHMSYTSFEVENSALCFEMGSCAGGCPGCNCDSLRVYDDGGGDSAAICGAAPPSYQVASAGDVTLLFRSDNLKHFAGFSMTWSCEPAVAPTPLYSPATCVHQVSDTAAGKTQDYTIAVDTTLLTWKQGLNLCYGFVCDTGNPELAFTTTDVCLLSTLQVMQESGAVTDLCASGTPSLTPITFASTKFTLVFTTEKTFAQNGFAVNVKCIGTTPAPPTPAPLTTAPLTSAPLTSAPFTTAPLTTSPLTTAPTTAPLTTAPFTTAPLTSAPLTSAPLTTSPLTTAPLTSAPLTSAPFTTAPQTTSPLTSAPLTTAPRTSAPPTPSPRTPAPPTPAPLTSAPLTTSPLTSAPLTTAPLTSAPLSSAPTPAPLTTSPLTPAPLTSAPLTTAPLTTAPFTTAPLTSAPLTLAPLTTSPLTSAPLTPAPRTSAPLTPAPLTPSPPTPAPPTPVPLTTAPLTSAPLTTAPLTTSPLTPAPLTTAPLTSAPSTDAPITSAPPTAAPTLPPTLSPTSPPTFAPTTAPLNATAPTPTVPTAKVTQVQAVGGGVVAGTVAVAAVATSLGGTFARGGGRISRSLVLLQLLDCPKTGTEELEFTQNPTFMVIGGGDYAQSRGAIVGNLLLLVGVLAIFFVAAMMLSSADGLLGALSRTPIPLLLLFIEFFWITFVQSAFSLFLYDDDGRLWGILTLLLCLAFLLVLLLQTRSASRCCEVVPTARRNIFYNFVTPRGEWAQSPTGFVMSPARVACLSAVFDGFHSQHAGYFVVQLICMAVLGGLAGWRPTTVLTCAGRAGMTMGVPCIWAGMLLKDRPFLRPIETLTEIVIAGLEFSFAVTAFISAATEREDLFEIASSLAVAMVWVCMVKMCIDILTVLYSMRISKEQHGCYFGKPRHECKAGCAKCQHLRNEYHEVSFNLPHPLGADDGQDIGGKVKDSTALSQSQSYSRISFSQATGLGGAGTGAGGDGSGILPSDTASHHEGTSAELMYPICTVKESRRASSLRMERGASLPERREEKEKEKERERDTIAAAPKVTECASCKIDYIEL